MAVIIEEATEVTEALCEGIKRLVPQLSSSASIPGRQELEGIVSSSSTMLLIARDTAGIILGSLTLALFRIPTGLRAWIEDVVVDASARSLGVGEALCKTALERAKREGATTVDLTTRPLREAANRLYRKLGFELRETNVYRFVL